ncbi:zinc-dependent metalloprotease [Planosporangium thailandense]|uniref:Zinc-dependent metalloprotease n=1 Tax=Planosporangium thailandense TaxID=765197 RepID=A0ABX0XUW0_9ACTN|nr:zinc-dependent metalloprotease [Planosporangium thailandense]NJC69573.1 zinc-dependent metalloprotease [Planosporangium thailandense]
MQRFLSQLQQLFATPGGGPVNWDLARQVAQAHLTGGPGGGMGQMPFGLSLPAGAGEPAQPAAEQSGPVGDPAIGPAERGAVAEALRLADLWLEPESALPSGIASTAAWTRSEWLSSTLDVWRKLCDPVAARMVSAMADLVPEEMRAQLGPMTSMVTSLGGALFGGQLGTALGSLAAEVLSAGDIGLPLGPAGVAALVPANIKEYGQGLEIDGDQVRLYVALREAAHQRLFGHVPWLRGHVLAAVDAYAAGIHVNREAIEEAMGRFDPTNPEGMQEIALEGVFSPEDSPQQKAALARLETALALIEGWVSHVVERAAGDRLPDVVRLAEAFRRRRAAGGPAEQTFAALVGLELRPRRLREATALWAALTEHRGVSGRDALWGHPDLLPDEDAFADPQTYAQSSLELTNLENELGDDTP